MVYKIVYTDGDTNNRALKITRKSKNWHFLLIWLHIRNREFCAWTVIESDMMNKKMLSSLIELNLFEIILLQYYISFSRNQHIYRSYRCEKCQFSIFSFSFVLVELINLNRNSNRNSNHPFYRFLFTLQKRKQHRVLIK